MYMVALPWYGRTLPPAWVSVHHCTLRYTNLQGFAKQDMNSWKCNQTATEV